MRFYRNHYHTDEDGSFGFSWHTSKTDAKREYSERTEQGNDGQFASVAEPIDIEPTKAGILAALNEYASHPNNG